MDTLERGTVFISHAPEDYEFVANLVKELKSRIIARRIYDLTLCHAELRAGDVFIPVITTGFLKSSAARVELTVASRRVLRGQGRLIPLRRQFCEVGGLAGMLEAADFTTNENFEERLLDLVRVINRDGPENRDPGRVRHDLSIQELVNELKNEFPTAKPGPVESQPRSREISIFASYASRDREFCTKLLSRLREELSIQRVVQSFLMSARTPFSRTILAELKPHDVYLAVLSPEHLSSQEVRRELVEASRLALKGDGKLIPVMRRQCSPTGLFGMLEVADFTDDDKLENALADLIRSLTGRPQREPGRIRQDLTLGQIAGLAIEQETTEITSVVCRENEMDEIAPEHIKIDIDRLAEFQRELHDLIDRAAKGQFDDELQARGIKRPAGMTADVIEVEALGEQPVAAETFVVLAIKYSPLIVPIGRDLWSWAWPKLRDYFDGAVREHDSE